MNTRSSRTKTQQNAAQLVSFGASAQLTSTSRLVGDVGSSMAVNLKLLAKEAHDAFTTFAADLERLQVEVGKLGERNQQLSHRALGEALVKLQAQGLRLTETVLAPGAHATRLRRALRTRKTEMLLCHLGERISEIEQHKRSLAHRNSSVETKQRIAGRLRSTPPGGAQSLDFRTLSNDVQTCLETISEIVTDTLSQIETLPDFATIRTNSALVSPDDTCVPYQLAALAKELRSAVVDFRPHEVTYRRIMEASDKVGKSSSGGWLGYHSRMHKRNFKPLASGECWDLDWGDVRLGSNQTRGDWHEYTRDEIIAHIETLAGNPDIERADTAARETGKVFDRIRDTSGAILAALSTNDSFLKDVCQRIEKIDKNLSARDIVATLGGARTHGSRDSRAVHGGIQVPPHIDVKANAMEFLSHGDSCALLANELDRAIVYVSTKNISAKQSSEHSEKRTIAAPRTASMNILFLDLAGWSKLKTNQITDYLQKALPKLASVVEKFNCAHQNTWGDAVVATFVSAKEAAECALDIRDMFRRGLEVNGIPKGLVPRISLHLGEVIIAYNPIIQREDIFGDAVHLAARLEPMIPKGQVYCTTSFAEALRAVTGMAADAHDIGEIDMAKGFGRVHVYAVTGPNEDPPNPPVGS
jgi:class 3 adenylate cyclase